MIRYSLFHIAGWASGCLLDLVVGDPHGIPHPVVYIGRLISRLERRLYPEKERSAVLPGNEQSAGLAGGEHPRGFTGNSAGGEHLRGQEAGPGRKRDKHRLAFRRGAY